MFLFLPFSAFIITLFNGELKLYIKHLIALLMLCLLISFCLGSLTRNDIWQSTTTLWQDATSKAPESWRPWHNLATSYEPFNPKKALDFYTLALKKTILHQKNDKGITYYNLGNYYHRIGDRNKALEYYRASEKIAPDFSPLLNNLGILFMQNDNLKEAIPKFERAILLQPQSSAPYINLAGLLLREQRNTAKAIDLLEQAVQIDNQNPLSLQSLGFAYRKMNLFGKAYRQYQSALSLRSKNIYTLLYLADLYEATGLQNKKETAMDQFVNSLSEKDLNNLIKSITKDKNFDIVLNQKSTVASIREALLRKGSKMYQKARQLNSKIKSMKFS
jgi:tetratricopeptide (TPR) repeat protein